MELSSLLVKLFNYILMTTTKYNIDESHGVSHSMNVLLYTHRIFSAEVPIHQYLKPQEKIIYISALLHDMCDKKYVNETEGLVEIERFLSDQPIFDSEKPAVKYGKDYSIDIGSADLFSGFVSNAHNSPVPSDTPLTKSIPYRLDAKPLVSKNEVDVIKRIIGTMSYSKVKRVGYPDLGEYQHAYHIVREADLLTAYDFDRSMIYHMKRNNHNVKDAFENAEMLFRDRVLRHNKDGLFVTEFSKQHSLQLHTVALSRMQTWRRIIKLM